ncbi:MinD/ParA family ATP-binding protein [Nocardioides sp. SYSU DS0651]|uniref:MinD/ParA family ATP-binding protein n=1 Tax=Nocardioides sp. SYSU DS0651 TaxID=3415955 RepID=UPI003F4BDE89
MSHPPADPSGPPDRRYTPEELEEFARRQLHAARSGAPVDPLSDPIPAGGQHAAPAGPVAEHTVVRRPAHLPPPPAAPPTVPLPVGPPPPAPPAPPSPPAEPRRFMTATDFLDRRDGEQQPGPATWGWRGRVRRWTGGVVKPRMGAKEQAYEADRRQIQKDFDGPRTIAFVNPKGGAAKTTGVLAAGFTFGTVRGGGVVAWDNNETRGTLGIRGARSSHRNTTRELLEDLGRFKDVYHSRIGDLGAFVRSQGDAHFDVLASDERPDVTGMIHADDFQEVHALLERFYRIILVDTGNNMRAENWLAAAEAADLLVVTSTVREDTGYSGLWMLDALQDAGYANLKYKTITVLSDPSPKVDERLAADLVSVYEQRTRGVHRVPYDAALVSGSVVPYAELSEATQRSWLRACAGMASAL